MSCALETFVQASDGGKLLVVSKTESKGEINQDTVMLLSDHAIFGGGAVGFQGDD